MLGRIANGTGDATFIRQLLDLQNVPERVARFRRVGLFLMGTQHIPECIEYYEMNAEHDPWDGFSRHCYGTRFYV
jgi:hypothetical protein